MVTIIKQGVIPPKVEPWPYNDAELICGHCKTVFTIEKEDRYRVTKSRQPGSLAIVEGVCPFCAGDIRITEPRTTQRVLTPWQSGETNSVRTLIKVEPHTLRIQ